MKKSVLVIIIIIAIIAIGAMFFVSTYNSLVQTKEEVYSAQGQIDTMLQRRADLIPNLVETVKGYASHEQQIITDITNARAKMMGAATTEEQLNANNELSSALSRLAVIIENYPDLKANQNFLALQDQLEGAENRISTARRDYNVVVERFNKRIITFPSIIIANMMGLEKAKYFEAAEGAKEVPKVTF